ncbi:hypothetical protein ACJX0J_037822, partial [Zea mays]
MLAPHYITLPIYFIFWLVYFILLLQFDYVVPLPKGTRGIDKIQNRASVHMKRTKTETTDFSPNFFLINNFAKIVFFRLNYMIIYIEKESSLLINVQLDKRFGGAIPHAIIGHGFVLLRYWKWDMYM